MRLFDQYRNLRRENYVLFFGRIVTNLGAMVWPMLTLIMNQKMGLSAGTVALLTVIGGICLTPVGILGGKLADRYSKKKVIVICDSVSVVFYIICGLIPLSYLTLVFILLAAGSQSMENPAYDALIADMTPTKDRERAYSLQYLGANIGMVLSPTIAGVLFKNALWLAFIISGVSIGCSTLLIFFKVKNTAPVEESGEESRYQAARSSESMLAVLKDNPVILLYILALGLYYAAYRQFSFLMPLDMGRVHGENGALIFGTVNSFNCIVVIAFTPLVTAAFRRMRETGKTLAGILLQTAGLVLFAALLGRVFWYYAAMLLFTWGEIFTTVSEGPYLTSRLPSSHRGRINGVASVVMGVLVSVFELTAGRLYDDLGSRAAWLFTYGAEALSIALCLLLIVWDRRRYPGLYTGGSYDSDR